MVRRTFWLKLLESAWARGPIVRLVGVRGVGKTSLCQGIPGVEYFHCELPRIRRQIEDPEKFLGKLRRKKVVLDEIHRLPNASEVLKMAASHFPPLQVIAIGPASSQSSSVSPDPLAEKITQVWLTPMMSRDLVDFGNSDLGHRSLSAEHPCGVKISTRRSGAGLNTGPLYLFFPPSPCVPTGNGTFSICDGKALAPLHFWGREGRVQAGGVWILWFGM